MLENTPDLFSQPLITPGSKRRIFTVSEITQNIKFALEQAFNEVWIEGEVSGANRLATGTILFNLKDNKSLLKCAMFASYATKLKFEIKDGLQLICFGRISVYEKDGRYQLYVEKIEPKGVGELGLALEQLKQRLEKEGLFAPAHKRPVPYLPSRIGIVTSLQGAAIKDILKVLERRFKDVHVIINPVRVQGDEAKGEIAQAIEDFNIFNAQLPLDEKIEVLIVGRGGGSIEDLWAFNEEIVARAIYSSAIPVISAVGHERDWTVADLVADVRAATPSVAAEMVLPKKEDLSQKLRDLIMGLRRVFSGIVTNLHEEIADLAHRLRMSTEHILELNISEYNAAIKKLALLNPLVRLQQYQVQINDSIKQINLAITHFLKLRQSDFIKAVEKLSNLSPLNIIARGYSITFKLLEGSVIKDIRSVKTGDFIKTKVKSGEIISQVKETHSGN